MSGSAWSIRRSRVRRSVNSRLRDIALEARAEETRRIIASLNRHAPTHVFLPSLWQSALELAHKLVLFFTWRKHANPSR